MQSVFPAAFALALLYMTVLGFDGIAIGYGKSQGLSATALGILRGIGSGFGIVGAILYGFLEKCITARKTGFIGLIIQQATLTICIASIWLPGSPFDPFGYAKKHTFSVWWEQLQQRIYFSEPIRNISSTESTVDWSSWTANGHSMISAVVLLFGIAIARLGLYMADLSITQIMQEGVQERQRGTVFGVQDSVAHFFSVLKDFLVILLPDPETFGLLIIGSFLCVVCAFIFYCYYLLKTQKINSSESTISDQSPNIDDQERSPLTSQFSFKEPFSDSEDNASTDIYELATRN